VATNYLTLVQTNLVPVFFTNLVPVPVTNLVGNPAAKLTAQEILDRVQRAQKVASAPCTGPGCTIQVP
jgi:hypothetical protein